MRRGQAAVEYLTTFGWVILLIVIVIGALAYFGFLSPNNFIPERCYFSSQMVCEDFYISYMNPLQSSLSFQVRNNFVKDIEIVSAQTVDSDLPLSGCTSNLDIGLGQIQEITCLIDARLFRGDKASIPVQLNFRRNETVGTPVHFVTGEIFGKVN